MSSHLRRLGNGIPVSFPTDEQGLIGRECPQEVCLGYFKVKFGTGLTGKDLPCICPYCGHRDSPSKFWTKDQIERARSVLMKEFNEAIRADLKELEFDIKSEGPFGISMSMKLEPGEPIPIYHYREKQLETNIICPKCTLNYSVYGLFAFCPDCGDHNSLQILQSNLALVMKQIALSGSIVDNDFRRHLVEDALENCVSSFDGFGRECCRLRASLSSDPKQAENLSFQNLAKASARLKSLFGVDLQAAISASDWQECNLAFMRRHLLAHRSGVVDQQYLAETKDSTNILGRRVAIDPGDISALTSRIENLGRSLLLVLPKIP